MENKNIYILLEGFEGTDGVREFQVIGSSFDWSTIRGIMSDMIEQDEYGLIKNNGIFIDEDGEFSTNFSEHGYYVEYRIEEVKIS